MRRVRYSVAMSLDGYIAGPKGESDWIMIDPEIDFKALTQEFDTVLMGRKSYEAIRKKQGDVGMPGMLTYVFSHTLRNSDLSGIHFSDNPSEMVGSLKAAPGKDIWLFGGGELFSSLLDLGLVDTIEVAVIPVLLGRGVPLLPLSAKQAKLKLVNYRVYKTTGTVSLEYTIL